MILNKNNKILHWQPANHKFNITYLMYFKIK